MGVKKKLSDLTVSMTIEMGNQKTSVEFEAETLFNEVKRSIQPAKKDDGDSPSFYENISVRCEYMRQHWERFDEI